MRHTTLTLTLAGLLLLAPDAFGQLRDGDVGVDGQRLAQTGMKFLSVATDPRAAALAGAITAQEGSSAAMFWNTAGMARLDGAFDVSLSQVQWIGEITYNGASAAFRPAGGRFGVLGVTVLSVNYGDLQQTVRADNEQGFMDTGTFSPSAMAVGVGYARALTDRFSVGGNVKYVNQSLGSGILRYDEGGSPEMRDHDRNTVAFDFGTLYHTGFRSLSLAMAVQNFSREVTYAEESFELPLTFRIGMSMNMMDFTSASDHAFVLSVDAQRPRDFAEQIKVGGEYTFMDLLSLRAGYAYPTDEQGINLGAGLNTSISGIGVGMDYAYTQFGIFGSVNRLALHLTIK